MSYCLAKGKLNPRFNEVISSLFIIYKLKKWNLKLIGSDILQVVNCLFCNCKIAGDTLNLNDMVNTKCIRRDIEFYGTGMWFMYKVSNGSNGPL